MVRREIDMVSGPESEACPTMGRSGTPTRVLVVDDEPRIAQIVTLYLQREGYSVLVARDGVDALRQARVEPPDLVILDLLLPRLSGWEVCRALRQDQRTANLPIIMVTARDDVADRILGLELGADDYVVKPFDPRELVARVRAVLRRVADRVASPAEAASGGILRCGDVRVDLERREVRRGGEVITLTRSEFRILATLARQPGRVFSRLELINAVQGEAFEGYERTIDSHIKNLRRKLEPDPRQPRYILTVFGVGYKLVSLQPRLEALRR